MLMSTFFTSCWAGVVGIGLQEPSYGLTAAMVLIFTLFQQCSMKQENSLGSI
jgi:hypothetical protein